MADSLTITLTPELSARVRAHMDRADHPSAEAVIERALIVLDDEHPRLEQWEIDEIQEACGEYERDPTAVFTSEQVQERLEASAQRLLAQEQLAKAG